MHGGGHGWQDPRESMTGARLGQREDVIGPVRIGSSALRYPRTSARDAQICDERRRHLNSPSFHPAFPAEQRSPSERVLEAPSPLARMERNETRSGGVVPVTSSLPITARQCRKGRLAATKAGARRDGREHGIVVKNTRTESKRNEFLVLLVARFDNAQNESSRPSKATRELGGGRRHVRKRVDEIEVCTSGAARLKKGTDNACPRRTQDGDECPR
ncbi:hypothetical protein DFH09DRAFT_1075851 [Mycena vulgaris]|nr:hypothetical protein DFH09DRAFT_1075851 [Mycena vulgaris]